MLNFWSCVFLRTPTGFHQSGTQRQLTAENARNTKFYVYAIFVFFVVNGLVIRTGLLAELKTEH
jgi:hypothetical protein